MFAGSGILSSASPSEREGDNGDFTLRLLHVTALFQVTSMVPEQFPADIDLSTEEDEALTERLNKSADCSAALADKLLQGWTLMGEHCPQCITPLMRNK